MILRLAIQTIVMVVTYIVGQNIIDAYRESQACDVRCWGGCDATWSDGSCAFPWMECGCREDGDGE